MSRTAWRTAVAGLAATTAAGCGLTACSGSTASPSTPNPSGSSRTVHSYVALGDSFTAAPYVPVTDLADGCLRSNGNYPALVARRLDAELTDVSCSGATTADLTRRQDVAGGRGSVAPQLAAVRPDTDLVTVGIGGNDEGLFVTLVQRCLGPGPQPLFRCGGLQRTPGKVRAAIARTGRHITALLRRVEQAAPDALVVLVGYPRLVDPDRSCASLPVSAGERPRFTGLERLLATTLRGSAERAGAEFADLYAASAGHAICSTHPWVNGARTDPERALAYHPFTAEQAAVADTVLEVVRGER